jgi:hypothetical protein
MPQARRERTGVRLVPWPWPKEVWIALVAAAATLTAPWSTKFAEETFRSRNATPTAVIAVSSSGSPEDAVRTFYRYIEQRQWSNASGLWTRRMQDANPPQRNINGRFKDIDHFELKTESKGIDESAGTATVGVKVVERVKCADGYVFTYHWEGNWWLVRSPGGWLLDAPALDQEASKAQQEWPDEVCDKRQ